MTTTDDSLAADIDACCRLTGEFTLRSGQVATEYFDKYLFEADPLLLARVAREMIQLVPQGTDLLAGLELGGVPIATSISGILGMPTLFVRKQAKTYGTAKLAEGPDFAGKRVTIIEDVITTGGAVRDAVDGAARDGRDRRGRGLRDRPEPRGREPAGRRRPRGARRTHQGELDAVHVG